MPKPSDLHEEAILDIAAEVPDLNVGGTDFKRRVCWHLDMENGVALAWNRGIIPDAYRIDKDAREIIVYEVIVTGTPRPDKLVALGELWHALKNLVGWNLRLIVWWARSRNCYEIRLADQFGFDQYNRARIAAGKPALYRSEFLGTDHHTLEYEIEMRSVPERSMA